jgi:hypothetical protein
MPLIETFGSGSAFGFGFQAGKANNGVKPEDLYKPAGTTRLLGLSFNESLTTTSSDSTLTVSTTTTPPSVLEGYATSFVNNVGSGDLLSGKGLKINSLGTINGVSRTFVAWYKGTQTYSRWAETASNTGPQWSPTVPVFADPRGSVYLGFGLDGGRLAVTEDRNFTGGKVIADNNWHCLAWTINSSNRVNAWVDGYRVLYDFKTYASPTNNNLDFIGQGYNYSANVTSPTNLDGIQVYNGVLSDSQIKEIASAGGSLSDPYVYARYWRVRTSDGTSHQPRYSRIVMRNKDGNIVNVSVATGDNCSDSGNIDGVGTIYNYDAGSPVAMVGGGMYTVYSGARAMVHILEYSTNGATWNEYNRTNINTNQGCGLYLTDGTIP